MKKPAPITLAQLRAAAPKGWLVHERRDLIDSQLWVVFVTGPAGYFNFWHRYRAVCRRCALAALRALKGGGR